MSPLSGVFGFFDLSLPPSLPPYLVLINVDVQVPAKAKGTRHDRLLVAEGGEARRRDSEGGKEGGREDR